MNIQQKAKLMKAWNKRLTLRAEGDKLRAEGDMLWAEGAKLWAEGDKLRAEGDMLWAASILSVLGNVIVDWSVYPDCIVHGVRFKGAK